MAAVPFFRRECRRTITADEIAARAVGAYRFLREILLCRIALLELVDIDVIRPWLTAIAFVIDVQRIQPRAQRDRQILDAFRGRRRFLLEDWRRGGTERHFVADRRRYTNDLQRMQKPLGHEDVRSFG